MTIWVNSYQDGKKKNKQKKNSTPALYFVMDFFFFSFTYESYKDVTVRRDLKKIYFFIFYC